MFYSKSFQILIAIVAAFITIFASKNLIRNYFNQSLRMMVNYLFLLVPNRKRHFFVCLLLTFFNDDKGNKYSLDNDSEAKNAGSIYDFEAKGISADKLMSVYNEDCSIHLLLFNKTSMEISLIWANTGKMLESCCRYFQICNCICCCCCRRGDVCIVVNVACKCGLTSDNYAQLQELYAKYKKDGLKILAFPCNQFGGQV